MVDHTANDSVASSAPVSDVADSTSSSRTEYRHDGSVNEIGSISATSPGNVFQTYPLPVELEAFVLSLLSNHRNSRNSLLSYSLVSRRCRALVLPTLFRSFTIDGYYTGEETTRHFCQAWMRRDPVAVKLSQYITECTFRWRLGGPKFPLQMHEVVPLFKEACKSYFEAFALLPNLSSLTLLCDGFADPQLLGDILQNAPIQKLTIEGGFGLSSHIDITIAQCTAERATSLRELKVYNHPLAGSILFDGGPKLSFVRNLAVLEIQDCREISILSIRSLFPEMLSLEVFRFVTADALHPPFLPSLSATDLPRLHTLACPVSFVPDFVNDSRQIRKLHILGLDDPASNRHFQSWSVPFINALTAGGHKIHWMHLPSALAILPWGHLVPRLETLRMSLRDRDKNPIRMLSWGQYRLQVIRNAGRGSTPQQPSILKEFILETTRTSRYLPAHMLNLSEQRKEVDILSADFPQLRHAILVPQFRWVREGIQWTASHIEPDD